MDDLDKLLHHISGELAADVIREARLDAEYEYLSVPLCVIDAVFSIGVNYSSTWATVCKWCEKHQWQAHRDDPNGAEHTVSEFVSLMEPYSADFNRMAKELFDNRQRTSPTSGITKAEAVYWFARVLQEFGIETLRDARMRTTETANRLRLKGLLQAISGQGSGLSYSYFLMLIGHEDVVKPDRMVRGFVADALAVPVSKLSAERVERLVVEACSKLRPQYPMLTPRLLDNVIWKHQRAKSGRDQDRRHKLSRSGNGRPAENDEAIGDSALPTPKNARSPS